ncbi:MAG: hypothetical protein CMQ20_09795 [Gammaproteobacteria bacterium]|jgi:hypothetical protein|nr:hypothetical protein [Gammaproteobacteria bacterium]|tara:strand:- start:81 stop:548 length:468 start_codon:yes stop_codon:yes gene_type:complete
MHITIGKAVDLLESMDRASPALNDSESLAKIVRLVQEEYLAIIREALSLLVQHKLDESNSYLHNERVKLEPVKGRIRRLVTDIDSWQDEQLKLSIEYLFTRARLVDELRMFPNFTLELLERQTLDQTMAETISYLETAMTGKQNLFEQLARQQPK